MTAQELFHSSVSALPRSERLRLAAMILQDLAETAASALDYSETWTEEDQQDLLRHSLQYAESLYPEDDELV